MCMYMYVPINPHLKIYIYNVYQTVQPSRYGWNSTDLKVWVLNPACILVGMQNVPLSAHDPTALALCQIYLIMRNSLFQHSKRLFGGGT